MKKINQSLIVSVVFPILLFLSQSKVSAQNSFNYQHWSGGEWTAEIIKEFSGGSAMPTIKIKHTRLGVSHISDIMDYSTNAGKPFRASIHYRVNDNTVSFYFRHCPETNVNDCFEDVIMNYRDIYMSTYQLKIENCSLASLQSGNENIKVNITVLSRPADAPTTPTTSAPADQRICPGVSVPNGWVIIKRELCVGECGGASGCYLSIIRDLRNRPSGSEEKICPGSTIPSGWISIRTEACVGTCGDRAGNACVMQVIKKTI